MLRKFEINSKIWLKSRYQRAKRASIWRVNLGSGQEMITKT